MTLWDAVLLGIIQGLTEFLPISSTAHLVLARQLMGHAHPEDAFTTVIQLGTLVAVVLYFRNDIVVLVRAVLHDFATFKFGQSADSRLAWLIVLGTMPVVIVGGLFKDWLKDQFYTLTAMALVAIVFALLMWASELWAKWKHRRNPELHLDREIHWREAIWIGCWQALALMPGASRSGTTITAGLFAGLSRSAAARFSFLLSLPAVFAAGMKDLYDEREVLLGSSDNALTLLVGLLVSGIVGYLAIAWLLYFLKRYSTLLFVVYRILLGVSILLFC